MPAVDESARRLAELAARRGFEVKLLVNRNPDADAPTLPNVLRELAKAATTLNQTGGTLLLTFAGHGQRVIGGDPAGKRSAAWCLKDQPLSSHELTRALEQFNEKVRLWILSDSCYSGAMVSSRGRAGSPPPVSNEAAPGQAQANAHDPSPPSLWVPPSPAPPSATPSPSLSPLASGAPPPSAPASSAAPPSIRAAVLFLSACKENQRTRQGAFTDAFVDLWANDSYAGSYDDLCDAVVQIMTTPGLREPQKYWVGEGPAFGQHKPPFPQF